MNPSQSHVAANEVEHLVQSVTDLQRRHAELDVMLGRINRDLEHRDRDNMALRQKYQSMKEEYIKVCQETENLRNSSDVAKEEVQSLQMGCSQLTTSIQSMEESIQRLQSQLDIERQRMLRSIAEAKESYSKLTAIGQAKHTKQNFGTS